MAKKSNGEGCIYKRANGTWEGKYTERVDSEGKQIRHSVYGKTKAEVVSKLAKIKTEMSEGTYVAPAAWTVSSWFRVWERDYLNGVKQNTRGQYDYQFRIHIEPEIGNVPIQKLTSSMIQRFYNKSMEPHEKVMKDGTKKQVSGLSPKSIKNLHSVLQSCLSQAVKCQIIKVNPCEACILPKVQKQEMKVMERNDISNFLEEIDGQPLADAFKVYLFCGMRRSELIGLQWQDIDFDKKVIHLVRQLKCERQNDKSNAYVFDTLKNGKQRTIHPAAYVFDILKKVQHDQVQNRLLHGDVYSNPNNLVFTDEIGKHLSHSTVYHTFKRHIASVGIPEMRLHDLRHTYATISIQNGDDIKTVSQNLGHATVAFTLDTYGHVTEEMEKRSADKMDEFIHSVVG